MLKNKEASDRTAWLGSWRQMGKGEGESGEEGASPGLKHGKVAARARQVAARAAQANHAALAVCTVTVMTLFIKFKFSILPQTYH